MINFLQRHKLITANLNQFHNMCHDHHDHRHHDPHLETIAPFILMKCSSLFSHPFQQESISCFKKQTGWSCWHRFCDVEISRSDSDGVFLSGNSGGEAVSWVFFPHVQMLLHWTKSKVTTFWDVLLNGCKFHKIPSFTEKKGIFSHQEFWMVCLMGILCIMTNV